MQKVTIKNLGWQDYQQSWQAMRSFTEQRSAQHMDELWLVEHPPVFTLGQAGKPEHIHQQGQIPVVHSDRGGQVTYHGPGQIILYCLIDLKRRSLGARALVSAIENSIIATLADIGIDAFAKPTAPGVYVDKSLFPASLASSIHSNDAKIAALGLRIRKGCSYHGLSLNYQMDMTPYRQINPCGYPDQAVCQIHDFRQDISRQDIEALLCKHLCSILQLEPIQATL